MEEIIKYFNGDQLASTTFVNKYAIKGDNKIETPKEMHLRLATEFARIETKYSDYTINSNHTHLVSDYYKSRSALVKDSILNLFHNFKYIIPGGSGMSGIGTNRLVSYSNCYVIGSPEDNYPSIMNARNEQVQLMKRRGGVGYDLSNLRPRGSKVNNAALTSTGAASFMDVCSDITKEVSMCGRRGALMLTISIKHPDVEEFFTKKQDLTKITGANISVKVTTDFMNKVDTDSDYIQVFPITAIPNSEDIVNIEYNKLYEFGNIKVKKVKAKELWNKLIHCAYNTAEPGIIFEDAMHNSPDGIYPKYKMISTNPCGS